QNLTGTRNRAGHVAHLEDVDAAVRIELHCLSHERISSIRLVDQVMLGSEPSTLFGRPTNLGRVRRPTVVGSVRPRPAAESSPRPFPAVAAVRRARRGPARRACAVPTFSKQL